MASYLLIESRDPYDSNDVWFCCDLARQLAEQGDEVTVFLVQNGVLPARTGARADGLSGLSKAGIARKLGIGRTSVRRLLREAPEGETR